MSSRLFKHQMASNNRPPAFPHLVTSYGEVFKFDKVKNQLTKLSQIDNGTTNGETVSFSRDGKYLVTTSRSTGYGLNVYKRTANAYTKIFSVTGAQYFFAMFSDDGKYLFAGLVNANPIKVWKKNDDDTFTLLASQPTSGDDRGNLAYINQSGKYFMESGSSAPFLRFSKFENEIFTPLDITNLSMPTTSLMQTRPASIDNLFIVPTLATTSDSTYFYNIDPVTDVVTRVLYPMVNDTYVKAAAVSPDKKYMATCSNNGTIRLSQYKWENGTFTKLAAPDVPVSGSATDLTYSSDGEYLMVSVSGAPWICLFRRVGDALINVPISVTFLATVKDIVLSPPL